ncbi:antibiotic resistance-related transmembrane efflux protein [Staphylococcus aureus]|nr:antibiotic resistance-related transmembrane efflux protein [Staphylococcus aureus]CXZ02583.1 antibiotic resistance-related transmembrane efflux protein [Staphylococcus aureus]
MNETYRGGNKLILGIVLGVITFWLLEQVVWQIKLGA